MQKWEYKLVSLMEGNTQDTLNGLGQSGWELVTIWEGRLAIFKRPSAKWLEEVAHSQKRGMLKK